MSSVAAASPAHIDDEFGAIVETLNQLSAAPIDRVTVWDEEANQYRPVDPTDPEDALQMAAIAILQSGGTASASQSRSRWASFVSSWLPTVGLSQHKAEVHAAEAYYLAARNALSEGDRVGAQHAVECCLALVKQHTR